MGGRNMDARAYFFYVATVNTPAVVAKMVGRGSQYAVANADKGGNPFDGAKTYRLNIPANVPALYGPLEPWFDKTWRPGEIEEFK
jgi:hypothetical protein